MQTDDAYPADELEWMTTNLWNFAIDRNWYGIKSFKYLVQMAYRLLTFETR
jgi:hypothetical protein